MLAYTSCWLVSSDFIPRALQDLERSLVRSAQFRLQYWMGSSGIIPRECTRTTNISVCTTSGSYHHSRGPILLLVAYEYAGAQIEIPSSSSADREEKTRIYIVFLFSISLSCSLALDFFGLSFLPALAPSTWELSRRQYCPMLQQLRLHYCHHPTTSEQYKSHTGLMVWNPKALSFQTKPNMITAAECIILSSLPNLVCRTTSISSLSCFA